MEMSETVKPSPKRSVWNAGRTVGAKRALKPKQIWEIRFYLNQSFGLRNSNSLICSTAAPCAEAFEYPLSCCRGPEAA